MEHYLPIVYVLGAVAALVLLGRVVFRPSVVVAPVEKPVLKQIPESRKSIWRQLIQNARGRADLKQPAGFLALLTLLYCAIYGVQVSPYIALALAAVVIMWWVGDTTEAVAVLMALYGKWVTPNTQINAEKAQVDSQNTTVQTPETDPSVE